MISIVLSQDNARRYTRLPNISLLGHIRFRPGADGRRRGGAGQRDDVSGYDQVHTQGSNVFEQDFKVCSNSIRGVMDESGEQFVAYFLPTDDTMVKRAEDMLKERDYDEEGEYEYKMFRSVLDLFHMVLFQFCFPF